MLDVQTLGVEEATLRYGSNTLGMRRTLKGAFLPASKEEVIAIVRWANANGATLHPVSTGRNWGYGSATPRDADTYVVDLSRMNTVLRCDESLGIVTIQPGVTQQILFDYLRERRLTLMVPTTGAGPNCSLIGNALERGYGVTHQFDSFANSTAVEAVLPDGSLYRSPLLSLGGEDVARSYKWGVGPYLDGIFAQGNFGIVVEMSFALKHRPEAIFGFFFPVSGDEELLALINPVRNILDRFGSNLGPMKLTNHHRLIRGQASDPRIDHNVPAWMGFGAIYAERGVATYIRESISGYLTSLGKTVRFIDTDNEKEVEAQPHLQGFVDLLSGRPSEIALPIAYYRAKKKCPPRNISSIDRDGCGLIWYAPLIPMKTEAVADYLGIATRRFDEFRLDRAITLTSLSERCFDSATAILFDGESKAERDKAHQCYEALFHDCKEKGFLPYRVPNGLMHLLEEMPAFSRLSRIVKNAVDPRGILTHR